MTLASSLAISAGAFSPLQPSEISARLESARLAIEGRFLEAGDVLSRAVDGVGALIASLDRMGENLNAETVTTTTGELAQAAQTLLSLPESLDARRARVGNLVKAGDGLASCIEEMRLHLAYLRVFAINIKITSGGILAAGPEFAIFAQEIYDCIELGRAQLDAFNDDLMRLDETLRKALAQEHDLGRSCLTLLPAVPDALMASAAAISAHHAKIAGVTVAVAALARDVQKKVGGGLAALQIGDITRQRIEHVQAGLQYLAEVEPSLSPDQRRQTGAFVHRLLAAQLAATAEDFHRDVSRMGGSLTGMATDASEILRMRDLAYGQNDGAERGFLRSLESHVGQALGLVGDMTAGETAAEGVSRSAAEAARELTERIAGIQTIRADVQMMALNTTLKCSRIGDTGKPLAVIAVELRQHAIHLEKSAGQTLALLDGLTAAAEAPGRDRIDDPQAGKAAAAAFVLGGAVARIAKAGDGVESDLAAVAVQGADVVDMLRRAAGRFDFHRQIGSVLDQAAGDLMDEADASEILTEDVVDVLRPLMDRLAKQYTMVQEREVHRAWAEVLGEDVSVAAAPVEDLDDGLF